MWNCDKLETFAWNQPKDTIIQVEKKKKDTIKRPKEIFKWTKEITVQSINILYNTFITYFVLLGQYFIYSVLWKVEIH